MRAGVWASFGTAAVLAFAGGPSARAQEPGSLRAALFGAFRPDDRTSSSPTVARYQVESSSFVLDRSGSAALLRFENDPEIWVLQATPGPRGDLIYRNDVGEPVLRSTRVGGLTLFTGQRPDGMPAAFSGVALPPRPSFIATPGQLLQAMIQASGRASRAAQRLVSFEAPDYTPGDEPIFADAAGLAAEAFIHVAGRVRGGRALVARFAQVRFSAGRAPEAVVTGPTVVITIAPRRGLSGRPSSEKIATVIARR